MQIPSLPAEQFYTIALVVIAAIVIFYFLKSMVRIAVALISGGVIAFVVYFLFGNLLWAGIAFIIVAVFNLFKR